MSPEEIMAAIMAADSMEDLNKLKKAILDVPVCLDSMTRVTEHLMAKTGKTLRSMKKVEARLREGFTEEDLILVIDWKAVSWIGTDMEQYVRPSTLFRSHNKTGAYLEEALNWQAKLMGEKRNAEKRQNRLGRATVPTFK